jgi:two-component system sensor histidine kinase KdpD
LPLGALALEPENKLPLRTEQRELLDAFCRLAAFAFERASLADEARVSALRAKTEEMRSSLLSAVSHDLRTPLAAITGAATSLRDDSKLGAATKVELLASICDEAERLERLVANLLDMTRLETGGVALKKDWVPLEELVSSALTRLEARIGQRPVSVDLPSHLPLLSVDPVLFEQVFINLFENAAKYTPPHTRIEVRAQHQAGVITIEVSDHGPGFPPGSEHKAFDKFFRGAHVGVSGVGLGLSICRAIVEAHGGAIRASNRPEGGALFRITLPVAAQPPIVAEAEVTS